MNIYCSYVLEFFKIPGFKTLVSPELSKKCKKIQETHLTFQGNKEIKRLIPANFLSNPGLIPRGRIFLYAFYAFPYILLKVKDIIKKTY